MTKDNESFVAAVISRLPEQVMASMSPEDRTREEGFIAGLARDGFTIDEAVAYERQTEGMDPNLDEATACKRMEEIRAAVNARNDKQAEIQLDKRDKEVRAVLLDQINRNVGTAEILVQQANCLLDEAKRIRESAKKEEWYKLGGYLDNNTIESLSAISPADLLADDPASEFNELRVRQ